MTTRGHQFKRQVWLQTVPVFCPVWTASRSIPLSYVGSFAMNPSFTSNDLSTLWLLVFGATKAEERPKNMNYTAKWSSLVCFSSNAMISSHHLDNETVRQFDYYQNAGHPFPFRSSTIATVWCVTAGWSSSSHNTAVCSLLNGMLLESSTEGYSPAGQQQDTCP